MKNNNNCEECVYYGDGKCAVVVWAEGMRVRLDPAKLNGRCDMFERNLAAGDRAAAKEGDSSLR